MVEPKEFAWLESLHLEIDFHGITNNIKDVHTYGGILNVKILHYIYQTRCCLGVLYKGTFFFSSP
jgi:hypothetical protein